MSIRREVEEGDIPEMVNDGGIWAAKRINL